MIRYLKRKPKKPRFNLMGEDSGAGATSTPPARVGIAMSTADRAALKLQGSFRAKQARKRMALKKALAESADARELGDWARER
jgi:hypothetical protein